MVTLDTNAVIYFLKGDLKANEVIRSAFDVYLPMFVSTVTEVELFSLPSITTEEIGQINLLLSTLSIIPLDSQIARKAGEIRRVFRLKTADSIIAATAFFTHSTLLTRNIKDFKKIFDLTIQEI